MSAFVEEPNDKKHNPEDGLPDDIFKKVPDDGMELLFIDKKKDIYVSSAVIGPAGIDFYTKQIITDLVSKAIKNIKPEMIEKEGYDILRYELVIKQRFAKS